VALFACAMLGLAAGATQGKPKRRADIYVGKGAEVQLLPGHDHGFGLRSGYYEFTLPPRRLDRHLKHFEGAVKLGPIDVGRYCHSRGYASAALSKPRSGPNAAYNNWVCVNQSGTQRVPADLLAACRAGYAQRPIYAKPADADDAYSWACYQPYNASPVGLSAMSLGSHRARLFLRIHIAGYADLVLTGTAGGAPILLADNGAVYTGADVKLRNLLTGASVGSISLAFTGHNAGSTLVVLPTAKLHLDAGVLAATKGDLSRTFKYGVLTLRLVKNGIERPVKDATYRGYTSFGQRVDVTTGYSGTLVKALTLGYPTHPCEGGAYQVQALEGTDENSVAAPIAGNGSFDFVVGGEDRYGSGPVAGRYVIYVVGRFTKQPENPDGLYNVVGTYSLTDFITAGVGRGAICQNQGSFHAFG
jgi:hypothetical protein